MRLISSTKFRGLLFSFLKNCSTPEAVLERVEESQVISLMGLENKEASRRFPEALTSILCLLHGWGISQNTTFAKHLFERDIKVLELPVSAQWRM